MCGIAGFVDRAKKSKEKELRSMSTCIRHRGPDADGFFFKEEDGVGLTHRRLSIIDLSEAANQPFYSANGRYCMVFNGEIYNYRDVAATYGIQQRTHSDTEVVIEAFAKKGTACLNDFNGMFSLAIWDLQEQELFLARDRFGKKPMLYYYDGESLFFASELKSFFALDIPKEINTAALQDYLFLEYVPVEQTIIKGITKLKNGHCLRFKNGRINISCYYDLFEKLSPGNHPVTENTALDQLDELLSSSIELRQVSDVPIGAFLSGGTDSSLICAIFQKQNTSPINTFTIGFDVADFDETKYANAVAKHIHSNQKVFSLNDKESIAIVDKLPRIYDEPFAAPSCIPSYLVCKKAREVATVAMSGDGGDELFMGYGYYFTYRTLKNIFRYDLKLGRRLLSSLLPLIGSKYERGARLFRQLDNEALWMHTWSEEQGMFSEKEVSELLARPYRHTAMKESWEKIDQLPIHEFEKISLFDTTNYLANNLLYKMDSASMANSLEVRNPYLDYRLVEYALNLPMNLKINGKTQKYLMKKLSERYLPKELIYRKKWGFPAPIGDWLYKDLSYLIDTWLSKEQLEKHHLFNFSFVNALVKEFRNGKKFHYKRLWSIIVFQMWYAEYFERK
ncbi:MAG: asparagine synthase (glutamine-hydrolyzing) [Chitinophagaceae bacterium]|nr:MAG: asparagine synthase (glutamine-hydrolyzing) [Chitinophagaceae bacterium]